MCTGATSYLYHQLYFEQNSSIKNTSMCEDDQKQMCEPQLLHTYWIPFFLPYLNIWLRAGTDCEWDQPWRATLSQSVIMWSLKNTTTLLCLNYKGLPMFKWKERGKGRTAGLKGQREDEGLCEERWMEEVGFMLWKSIVHAQTPADLQQGLI